MNDGTAILIPFVLALVNAPFIVMGMDGSLGVAWYFSVIAFGVCSVVGLAILIDVSRGSGL